MEKSRAADIRLIAAGTGAGLINGFLGGGGGMVLVPALINRLGQRRAFATSVAAILPVCAASAAVYYLRGELPLDGAFPFLAGGAIGGIIGGIGFRRVPDKLIRRIFALLMIYGGVRSLL